MKKKKNIKQHKYDDIGRSNSCDYAREQTMVVDV